jgi:hypothetical protein
VARGQTPSSPDRVAFLHRGKLREAVMMASLDGNEPPRELGVATLAPRWSADGRAVWALRDGAIRASAW